MGCFIIEFRQFESDCDRKCVVEADDAYDAEQILRTWHMHILIDHTEEVELITQRCESESDRDT